MKIKHSNGRSGKLLHMDIEEVRSMINCVPGIDWPLFQEFWNRMTKDEVRASWKLPATAVRACGGNEAISPLAVAAVGCTQIAIIIVDDILDDEPDGVHLEFGAGEIANLAQAFQAAGFYILAEYPDAIRYLAEMGTVTAVGQSASIKTIDDEDAYWEMVNLKSTPFYACSLALGGAMSGANAETLHQLHELGTMIGRVVQLRDDLNDAMALPADPDWVVGNNILLLYGRLADHKKQKRLEQIRSLVLDDEKLLDEAQEILIQCGAVDYVHHLIEEAKQPMLDLLDEMVVADKRPLRELVDHATDPPIGIENNE